MGWEQSDKDVRIGHSAPLMVAVSAMRKGAATLTPARAADRCSSERKEQSDRYYHDDGYGHP
jgi:hypothetical protein